MKSNQPPGFESVLSALLFCDLQQIYKDNVFLEWPISMGKIDVRVCIQGQDFICELKMYYAKDEKSYENDFSKLYQEVKNDSHSIAVHAHVQIYPNSNFPAHNYLMKKEKELASKNGYWQHYKEIGRRDDIHIARLIFSKKQATVPLQSSMLFIALKKPHF